MADARGRAPRVPRLSHLHGLQRHSDNRDHFVTTIDGARLTTHSLAIHYLAYHRDEVPVSELAKVERLSATETQPTAKQLRGS
jgi:hypothetical protein